MGEKNTNTPKSTHTNSVLYAWCAYHTVWLSAMWSAESHLPCRVQQIQLLGRDMKGPAHDKLWNQLEAEIHLHRHKTVIRACRGRNDAKKPLPSPADHVSIKLKANLILHLRYNLHGNCKRLKMSMFQFSLFFWVGTNIIWHNYKTDFIHTGN